MAAYQKWYSEANKRLIYATKLPTQMGGLEAHYTIIVWKDNKGSTQVFLTPQYTSPKKWVNVMAPDEKEQQMLSKTTSKIKKEVIRQLEL